MKKKLFAVLTLMFVMALGLAVLSACSLISGLLPDSSETPSETKYKVIFIVDGEIYSTIETSGEETISLPQNPSKEDYDFDGWYLDEDTWQQSFTKNSLLNEKLTSDISVYAKWQKTMYDLGEIKYNTGKKSISIHDTIDAELFEVSCLDINGAPADITVSVVGQLEAGKTVSILIVAQAEGSFLKSITLDNIKVYGDPTLQISDDARDYVNLSDQIGEWDGKIELNNSLFGGSGKDSFGSATKIRATVDGTFEAGGTVAIVIHSIDPLGYEVTKRFENIKVYGNPIINYNENKVAIRQTDELVPGLFEATARDSFGVPIEVKVILQNAIMFAGNTLTIRLSASDSKGNTAIIDIEGIKVYGAPTINNPSRIAFKVEEEITVNTLGLTAYDSFNESPKITISLIAGEQKAGTVVKYIATAIDAAGNVTTLEIETKIYDMPIINIDKTFIKDTEEADAITLQATATDSFEQSLEVSITQKSGVFAGGNIVYYSLTAIDAAGNIGLKDDVAVKIYSLDGININYKDNIPQAMKLTSHGEEFITKATDSFGESCTVTLEAAEGYTLNGGRKVSLYIVVTDIAGNIKRSDLFSNIKVYDMPTLRPADEAIGFTISSIDDLDTLFIVEDSFGDELVYTAETNDVIIAGQYIDVAVTATDNAGNEFSDSCRIAVREENTCVVLLFWGDELLDTLIVDDAANYTLPISTEYSSPKGWYNEAGTAYTNAQGKGTRTLSTTSINYLYLYTQSTIYSVSELEKISLSGNYILMKDLDLQGVEWTPIGTKGTPFTGTFDGNGHTISNWKITDKTTKYSGLFGYVGSATLQNLSVTDFQISVNYTPSRESDYQYYSYAGGLVGYNEGIIINCYTSGSVSITSNQCAWHMDGIAYAGGLVGYNVGSLTSCYATGSVRATALDTAYAGGLVGNNTSVIKNCFATGTASASVNDTDYTKTGYFPSATAFAGGLLGLNTGNITNCYATGKASASAYAYSGTDSSGRANATATAYAGGLVGNLNSGSLTNCYATGDVTAYGRAYTSTGASSSEWEMALAGGLVGSNGYNLGGGTVTNCYLISGQIVTETGLKGYPNSSATSKRVSVPTELLSNLQSEAFLIGTLNWHDDDWIFHENAYPTLRG